MKKIISLIIIFNLLISVAGAWPFFNKKETKKPVTTPQIEQTKTPPTIAGGREIVKQINNELKTAKEENLKLKESLNKALEQVKTAKDETVVVQKQADNLKEWGVIQQAEAQRFMEKYNNAVKRYHRLKLIAAAIAAAVGVLLGLQFMSLAPPPYNLGVPVGAAGLFAALVWFLL